MDSATSVSAVSTEALSVLLVASRLTERGVLYGLLRLAHDTSTPSNPFGEGKVSSGHGKDVRCSCSSFICSSSVVARFHA